jgi:hypothetical protein
MRSRTTILILGTAQFVMVLDTTMSTISPSLSGVPTARTEPIGP